MPKLPQFQGDSVPFQMMQNRWAALLNPILSNPLNEVTIIKNVKLVSGVNIINHLLQKPLTGWFIIRQRGPAAIYDVQDANQSPQLTLKLNSSAQVSVDLAVF